MARKKESVNLDGCIVWLWMIAIVGGSLFLVIHDQMGLNWF